MPMETSSDEVMAALYEREIGSFQAELSFQSEELRIRNMPRVTQSLLTLRNFVTSYGGQLWTKGSRQGPEEGQVI